MATGEPRALTSHGRLEVALALVAAAFALPRVARDFVLMGDSTELVSAASVWGVPRAPGHPLYTAFAHLASLIPVGSVVWRIHATSVLYHAIAVGCVAAVTRKLTRSVAAAVCSAAFLVLSRTFLLGSLYAEIYPLSDALLALSLWLALEASVRPAETRFRWLAATAVVLGTAAAHDPQLWLGIPAILILVARAWTLERKRSVLRTLALLGTFVLPIALCLGLLWIAASRHPSISSGDIHDWRSFWHLVLRRDYGGLFSTSRGLPPNSAGERIGAMALGLGHSIGGQGIVTAAIGSFVMVRSHRLVTVALLLMFVMLGPFQAVLVDFAIEGEARGALLSRLFSSVHVPLAILSGVGALAVARRLERLLARKWTMPQPLVAALAVLPGLSLAPAALSVDLSHDHFGGAMVGDLYRGVPDGSLVMVSGDVYTSAADAARVMTHAGDHSITVAPLWLHLPWVRAQLVRRYPDLALPEGKWSFSRAHELIEREIGRRRVFVVPGLLVHDRRIAQRFSLVPHGMLLEVYASPVEAERDRPAQLKTLSGVADGSACRGCVMDPRTAFRPSQHLEVLLAYSVTLENSARFASRIGARDESLALFERTRGFDQAVGLDMLSVGQSGE